MRTLYELIQSAHRIAKENAEGRPVDFIQLHHPVDYRRNNEKTLEITAGFDEASQNLQRISVTLTDGKVDETFNEEELQSFTRFIGNPYILNFKGSNPEDSVLYPIFDLDMTNYGSVVIAKFKSKYDGDGKYIRVRPTEDGSFMVVDYDKLGQMFGLNLKGKNKIRKLQPFMDIDSSRVPEAYEWAFVRGFSPHLYLSAKGKRALYLYGIVHSHDASLANRFTLEDGIDFSEARYRAMTPEQVDTMEAQISEYRGTDLAQMPFNVWKFDVVTDKPEVPNLKNALRKGWGIGDKIFNLFQFGSRALKSESMYKELPVVSYRQLSGS